MAVASFLAGALPLSMTLSQSQLRLISSIGVGVLVGTSLIVIIPEGIEAAASSPTTSPHAHKLRSLSRRSPWNFELQEREVIEQVAAVAAVRRVSKDDGEPLRILVSPSTPSPSEKRNEQPSKRAPDSPENEGEKNKEEAHVEVPAFEVGFSMVLGFILMFLIDRLPKHASDGLHSGPQPQYFSLDNLGGNGVEATPADEEQGFLASLTPTPKYTRSLATTIGLVIHAAADGIAMGASSATSNVKLGFVIFIAIMIHKAPAAFGLTSVLLRQGLSKRAARGHLAVFSLAAPTGAISTWLMIKLLGGQHLEGDAGMWWTGMLLLFSGGTFLYVAMHAMQDDASSHNHESHSGTNGYADGTPSAQRRTKGPDIRDTLATVAGMLLPLLTQFGHHH
ncbi:Zinc/iron permease [Metarhizium album ARSEF 1941]|uniref:Zinc/iron permease n=1 Tax=Metarhizium album (strain ARSEF 1941) TaxID=1081103 RepID=A0A0B2WX56_METAS|nr:Zinc/iron permease [Metarhizium album ARSEF 1941]KHO00802.1 Zinc/iron permease [Metarhizium album ARSEF 1941]